MVLAQQLANVDQISRGRLLLGLGVGWSLPSAEREWAACGADHKRRVRRLEEQLGVALFERSRSGARDGRDIPVPLSPRAMEKKRDRACQK